MIAGPLAQPLARPLATKVGSTGTGFPYPRNGRVLDLAAFTYTYSEVRDKSPEDNETVLYSGRAVSLDGVNDTVSYPTDFDNEEITVKVLLRSATTGNKLLAGTFGELYFNVQSTGIWKEYTDTSTISGSLDWSPSADVEVSELRVYDSSGTLVHRYLHNEYVDETVDGLDGLLAFDTVGGTHGTYTGCTAVTQIGFDSALAGLGAYGDYQWFNGVDTAIDTNVGDNTYKPSDGVAWTLEVDAFWDGKTIFPLYSDGTTTANATCEVYLSSSENAFFGIRDDSMLTSRISYTFINMPTGRHVYRFEYDGGSTVSSLKLFIDGTEHTDKTDSSQGLFSSVAQNSLPIRIGRRSSFSTAFGLGSVFNWLLITNDNSLSWDGTLAGLPAGWTVNGSPNTVAELRTTPPQVLGMDFNQYRWFNGVDSEVAITSIDFGTGNWRVGAEVIIEDTSSPNPILGDGANWVLQLSTASVLTCRTNLDSEIFNINLDSPYVAGTKVKFEIERSGNTLYAYVDGVQQAATLACDVADTFACDKIGNRGAVYFKGSILNANINSVAAYKGYGATPWADTIGSNDGTESGTFEDVLTSESLTKGTDALGNAIESPRSNKTLNADGVGYGLVPSYQETDDFSLVVRVDMNNLSSTVFFAKWDTSDTTKKHFDFYHSVATARFILRTNTAGSEKIAYASTVGLSGNHYLVCVKVGSVVSMFYAGQELAVTGDAYASPSPTPSPLLLGTRSVGVEDVIGGMESPYSDVKIYNRALTAEEVAKFK